MMARTGRPRSAEADAAILDATREALVEQGWGGLTMADVAARAGVAKTTLYRRWANRNELVVDALGALFDELRMPDHGTLAADIEDVVLQFAALLDRPEVRTALMAVIAESSHDDGLRRRVRTAIVDRQKRLVVLGRHRAQRRGEIPPDDGTAATRAQVDLVFDVVAGAVVHRILVSGERVDAAWAAALSGLLREGLAGGRGGLGSGREGLGGGRGGQAGGR
ncbi:TetR/AcrR family transcriptional regulator [Streptantibioticus silvisoli]|uniref:TetR/AcrR family transcriptional regulator n=1 Tax=Streptantibioticus silvisoli TaxID=2705255 RepID=UPI003F6AFCD8